MKRQIAILAVVLCAAAGAARAADSDRPTLSVARITSNIQEGQKWGWAFDGTVLFMGCVEQATATKLEWGAGPGRINVRALEQPAREELKKEGFAVAGDATDPFAEKTAGDLSLGATITSLNSGFCFDRFQNRASGRVRDSGKVQGSTSMEIDWQIYSNVERRVIAKVHTTGNYKTATYIMGGFEAIMFGALDDSISKLTASPEFRQAISQQTSGPSRASSASSKSGLILAGAKDAKPIKIPD